MKTKKIISILLSVLMVLTSFPVVTFADDESGDRFTKTTDGYIICDDPDDLHLSEDDDFDGYVDGGYFCSGWKYYGESRTIEFLYYNRTETNQNDTTVINCVNKNYIKMTFFRACTLETWAVEHPNDYQDYLDNNYSDEQIYNEVFTTATGSDGKTYNGFYDEETFEFLDSVQKVVIGNSISKIEALPLNQIFENVNCVEFEEGSQCTQLLSGAGGVFESTKYIDEVVLPASVTSIGRSCFANSNVKSVDLSNTQITVIPDMAFYNTHELQEVKFNDKITKFGAQAFKSSALEQIDLPSTLTTHDYGVFHSSSITSIDFENTGVIEIPLNAFYLSDIETVKLNPDTEIIGDNAFRCSMIKEINIPESVYEIGDNAFLSTSDLERITITGNVDIGDYAFRNSGLKYLDMRDANVSLGKYVFRNCKLDEVHLPTDNAFILSTGAFRSSTIGTLDMPSANKIETEAFGSSKIENVVIPESCTKMASDCFSGADINYIRIESPSINIYEIDYFSSINNLTTIVYLSENDFGLPDSFTGLDNYRKFMDKNINIYGYKDTPLYRHCIKNGIPFHEITEENGYPQNAKESAEENSYSNISDPDDENNNNDPTPDLPSTLGKSGTYEGGKWSAIAGNSITFSGKGAIESNIITDNNGYEYTLAQYVNLANIKLIYIKDGITSIPDNFLYIDDSTKVVAERIVLPSDLKSIGKNAFRNTNVNVIIPQTYWQYYEVLPDTNTFLEAKKCVLPEGITSIGEYAFADTKNLTDMQVIMPRALEVVSEGLFYGSNVKSVYFPSNKATAIEKKAFAACDNLVGLTLPFTVESVYSDYVDGEENVTDNAFGYKSTGANNTRLTVSCAKLDGAVADYCNEHNISLIKNEDYNEYGTVKGWSDKGYFNWYYYEVTNTVTYEFVPRNPLIYKLDNFENAWNNYSIVTNAKEAPVTVTRRVNWFRGIENLPDIGSTNYPQTEELAKSAFSVDKIDIEGDIRLIYASDVFSAFNPKSINLPDTLLYLDGNVFGNCERLESVVIPDTVYEIGPKLFNNCPKLQYANLGNGIDMVPTKIFYNCKSLRFVDIGDKVQVIDKQAFYNCTALEEIVIPDKVSTIKEEAFYNCISAQTVTIGKNVAWLGENSFTNSVYCENIIIKTNSIVTKDLENAFKDVGIYTNGITLTYGFGVSNVDFKFVKNLEIKNVVFSKTVSIIKGIKYAPRTIESFEVDEENPTFSVKNDCLYQEGTYLILAPKSKRNITIDNDCTAIGTYAFEGSAITKISIPDKVYFIHDYAFANCDQLKSVKLGDGVGVIYEGAFMNCSQLRLMFFPDNLYQVGDMAFKNCKNLANVTFVFDSENFSAVGVEAFYGCDSLKSVVLPENTKRIKERAFANCKELESIYIRNSDVYTAALSLDPKLEIYTIAGSPAHAYARTNDITVHAYMDEDAFLEECAIKLDELAGYIGICDGEHGNIEYLTVYEADCEHEGYKVGVCEYCWEILEEVHTPALGHDKKVVADVPATATTKGFRIEECNNCGETYKTEYPPTGSALIHETHTVTGRVTVAKNKNCDSTNYGVGGVKIIIDDMVAATTADNGMFTLTLDTGTYEAELKYAYGFTRKIYIVVEDEDISIREAIPIIACDFNKDSIIDNEDMRLFAMVISSTKDDVSYMRYVDLNNDGYINGKDQGYIRTCIGANAKTIGYETIIVSK